MIGVCDLAVVEIRVLLGDDGAALTPGLATPYPTDLALLELTDRGLTLRSVMPGIDIRRDLLANSKARIHVPDDPAPTVVPAAVVTGEGFSLDWPEGGT